MAALRCPSCRTQSEMSDYCDSCGAALHRDSRSSPPASGGTAGPETLGISGVTTVATAAAMPGHDCPACGSLRGPDDLFCERCGVNFATGRSTEPHDPTGRPVATARWTAVVTADRAAFDRNQEESGRQFAFPEAPLAREVALLGDEVVVGRRHESAGFYPDIDLAGPVLDPGVSRRHAVLRRQPDGSWAVTDTGSTNGTWLNGGASPLEPGVPAHLEDGDRIQVGLFTLITLRHETEATS